MERISISQHRNFFFELPPEYGDKIFILEDTEAKDYWNSNFDANAKNLYSLDANHWLLKSKTFSFDIDWIEKFNNDDLNPILFSTDVLEYLNWLPGDNCYLLQGKKVIAYLNFATFLSTWKYLFYYYDEGSILLVDKVDKVRGITFCNSENIQLHLR